MPTFCSAGQSARVFFQYSGQPQDNVSVQKSPVTVTTETIPDSSSVAFNGGQCPQFYTVKGTFEIWDKAFNKLEDIKNISRQNVRGPIQSIRLENPVIGRDSHGMVITGTLENGSPELYIDSYGNYFRYESRNLRNIEIIPQGFPDSCGNRSFGGQCKFTVKDADGVVRFEKTASTCPEYVVVCGSNCPPGTVECCGCCLPCESTKAEIQALTNRVRGM